ncbi:MAG: ACP S-malonyltransferase [Dehalococcoidia bacterium]|nr:MAG: ACP S-malonyltransferase [Dehalococcoidia bacterium]
MVEPVTDSVTKVAYVFPGQGSQAVGMGYDLFQNSREAKEVFEEADEALGIPISRLCFEGPEDELRKTINSQPAILIASIACLRAATGINGTLRPAFVAGHSLGEYTALVVANVLDFTDAVRLVRERGRLMYEAGIARPGSMAAIIGLDDETVDEVCRETGAQIANFNCSGQVVVSGTKEALALTMDLAQSRGAVGVVPLEVSGAFHSELMQPAVEGMNQAISQLDFRSPQIPIVANCTARPITTSDEVKEELVRQLCNCVQWQPSVEYMIEAGVSTFIEIGPGIVLSKLIKRISRGAKVLNMGDQESIQATSQSL